MEARETDYNWWGVCQGCGREPGNGMDGRGEGGEQHADGCPAAASEVVDRLRDRVRELEHLARLAGDFRDQIHPDVNWDRVPPWTMAAVQRLDEALAAFDESDK